MLISLLPNGLFPGTPVKADWVETAEPAEVISFSIIQ